jgi:oligoribonuclease NrnB/cAMP/cGMP phosphodiesterase (DHH superfamily)
MHTTVLYHDSCLIGFGAAFACWQVFGEDAQYVPVSYGQAIPDIPLDHTTYIVDFSYPADTLRAFLAERIHHRRGHQPQVIVLDHHASAERELSPLIREELPGLVIVFNQEESGATLTWKYLYASDVPLAKAMKDPWLEEQLPRFFRLLRDRALWQWRMPHSHEISLVTWSLPREFAAWQDLQQAVEEDSSVSYHEIVQQGMAIKRYADVLVKDQAERAFIGTLGGYEVPIVNTSTLCSEVGDYLCTTHPDIPFCAYFFDRPDKRQWGLRGRGKVDLSVIAQSLGGGGHAHAAGFTTERGWLP